MKTPIRPSLAAGLAGVALLAAAAWHLLAEPAMARPPVVTASVVGVAAPAAAAAAPATVAAPEPSVADVMAAAFDGETPATTGLGYSGSVFLRVLRPDEAPVTVAPGVHVLDGRPSPAAVAVLAPFSRKLGAWVGSYEVGYWPGELRRVRSPAYANPDGFVVVTPETRDIPVSRHFRLGDFVTHDRQQDRWPKVVVLDEALLDKLELVLAELERRGVAADRAVILSGFRTPAHNRALGDASGRARESRHQYGDAADLIIDVDRDGRMDDLNGDGRINPADVRVIEAAVNRVERDYPDLAGGLGLYRGEGHAGPFAHIDVRGAVARWDRTRVPAAARAARRTAAGSSTQGTRVGSCSAPPQFIALCGRRRG